MKDVVDELFAEAFGPDGADKPAPSRSRPPPDTPWRALAPLPSTFPRYNAEGPAQGSCRRRGGFMFFVNEIRQGRMVGRYGWTATADGRPLMSEFGVFAFYDESHAQDFCDELDLTELGDFQL